jgi:hypothetical protein
VGAAKSSPRATIQAPKPMPEEDACQTGMEVLGGCHGMDRGLMGISLSLGEGSTYHPWILVLMSDLQVWFFTSQKKKGHHHWPCVPCKVWYHKTRR